jgi:hypothetical protein
VRSRDRGNAWRVDRSALFHRGRDALKNDAPTCVKNQSPKRTGVVAPGGVICAVRGRAEKVCARRCPRKLVNSEEVLNEVQDL